MATVFRLAAGVFFLVFLSFSIASASASPSVRSSVLFCTNEAPGSTIVRDCQSLPRVMARMDREMPPSEGPREELVELPYRPRNFGFNIIPGRTNALVRNVCDTCRTTKAEAEMKVVLFCGGAGMRLRGYVDDVPKPMVQIGTRPILWHLMKYYAHFGHKDFILCLGYKGNVIKDYFLQYDEAVSNDFVWSQGGKKIEFINRDIDEWTITFVETGITCYYRRAAQGSRAVPARRRDVPGQLR